MSQDSSIGTGNQCSKVFLLLSMVTLFWIPMRFFACAPHIKTGENVSSEHGLSVELFSAEVYHEKGLLDFKNGNFESAIKNARAFLAVQKEFGSFDAYIWQFVGGKPQKNAWKTMADIPPKTPESDEMSKDLIKRGFKFVGPTICYSHMQAVGMVNDHTVECFRYKEVMKKE